MTDHPSTDHPLTLEQMREAAAKLKARHSSNVTELPPDYAAKLASAKDKSKDTQLGTMLRRADYITHRPQKAVKQAISYEDARSLTWAIMKATLAQRGKKFIVDDHNRPIIVNLIRWFIGDAACEWDLQKGIFIFGNVGTGKTFLLDTMQALTLAARLPGRHFKSARCIDVAELVRSQNGDQKAATRAVSKMEAMHFGHWCFDDLGHEPLSVKVWGDERNIMEPIITRRYNAFTAGDCITHATSNLSPDELETMYGSRVADRFREMFTYVLLDGDSRRV